MSAAADDPRRAPARVAVVSTIGYSAFLAGPPLLGILAEQVGYRQALLAITVPILIGLLVVNAARPLAGTTALGTVRPTDTMRDPALTPPAPGVETPGTPPGTAPPGSVPPSTGAN